MRAVFRIAIVAAAAIMPAARTNAAISGTSGAVIVASPPADVSSNHWESDTQIRAFAERQAFTLSSDIPVDISRPGASPGATDANLSPATIPAGTRVNSYLLHFDVVGTRPTNDALEATGSITFNADVLGLIALSDTLNQTTGALGLSGVTYSSGSDHGLELNPAGGGTSDSVTLSPDRRTLAVDLFNASFADDLRVVTAVPEPAGVSLLALAVSAFLPRRRRAFPWRLSWGQ